MVLSNDLSHVWAMDRLMTLQSQVTAQATVWSEDGDHQAERQIDELTSEALPTR